MFWEELTSADFEKACKKAQCTCIIPIGIIEKHGQHLPLATDMIIGREMASRIAKEEPVVIFPYYYFGQISEAKHVKGTIAISPSLQMSLLSEICDEVSRNGFNKIILLNSHGGNIQFLNYFMQGTLHTKKDYAVYCINTFVNEEEKKEIAANMGTDDLGYHGGNKETAAVMASRPDLVKMDCIEQEGLTNYRRLEHLKNTETAIWWYANHPTHFAGDPSMATAEKGEFIYNLFVKRAVESIRIIKEDNIVSNLQNEYFSKF